MTAINAEITTKSPKASLHPTPLKSPGLEVGGRQLKWGKRTYIMGVVNITPDSFSGDGLLNETATPAQILEIALEQAQRFATAGADILDVGGESTRPGARALSIDEEMERVIPVVEALSARTQALISIDTYKSEVAEAALRAGAHMINDIWGLRYDPRLATIAAEHAVPLILMHNRSSWANAEVRERLGGHYVGMHYEDLIKDIQRELLESAQIARNAGVAEAQIILDPGIGFGKTVEQNLELIDRLREIRALGYPVLLGPSRKSFIGYTLDLPPNQRIEGTAAAVAIGIARGADIVRVHDVTEMVRVVRMSDAIIRRPGA